MRQNILHYATTCLSKSRIKKRPIYLVFIPLCFLFIIYWIISLLEGDTNFQSSLKLKGLKIDGGYLIDTPGCKILNFETAPKSLQSYFINDYEVSCSGGNSSKNITSSKLNILSFYPENIDSQYINSRTKEKIIELRNETGKYAGRNTLSSILTEANVGCCYKVIQRGKTDLKPNENVDFVYQLSIECFKIEEFEIIIEEHDSIVVYCSSIATKKFYVNIHLFVQDKREKINTDKPLPKFNNISKSKLSVIIYGIDSLSRLNFLRVNPKTYNYLINELNAFEFKGFNKVGDNTFPHGMALLTGHLWNDDINNKCTKKLKSHFDNCSFIWKDFKKKGYVTSFIEDYQSFGTFTYNRRGFRNPPTDHYTRPSFLAADDLLQADTELCMGDRLTSEVLQAYSHDLLITYQNELSFSYIWAVQPTHDDLNLGIYVDEPNVRYLRSLKEDGILEKSILLFISDHGMRFGSFRLTDLGKYEENLPYLFIVVPKWFRERYPLASTNLRENERKFFTPLDIYETLQDILKEKYSDSLYLNEETSQHSRRISLFKSLPVTRTCADIGMPIKYCACQNYVPMEDTDGIFKEIAIFLREYINEKLDSYPQCAKVTKVELNKVLMGYGKKSFFGRMIGMILSVQASYVPGDALIEITILYDKKNITSPFHVSGDILRINKYGKQSHCVEDRIVAKKICICKDMI